MPARRHTLAATTSRRRHTLASAFAALTLGCALAQTAGAAEIKTDRACYSRGGPVGVTMSGMPPGETVDVRVDDDVLAEVVIDASGNGSANVAAPDGRPPRPVKVRAQVSLQILAETTLRLDVPVVEMSPTSAKPTTRVTYALTGFKGAGAIYAHVVRGSRHVRTVSLGAPAAPCGELVKRIAQLPINRPPKGRYTVQFDQSRTYRAGRAGSVRRSVRVRFAPK